MLSGLNGKLGNITKFVREHWDERFLCAMLNCIAICMLSVSLGQSLPVSIVLIGPASSGKSTLLSFLRNLQCTVWVDDFSPKAFVTHAASKSEKQLAKIDLLPKMRDHVLITSDLAPMFGQPVEHLKQTLGTFTRIMDGQGLETASGLRGTRGYSGELLFCWLSASTPIPSHVWILMSRLGSRLLFQKINNITSVDLKYIKDFPIVLNCFKNDLENVLKPVLEPGVRYIEYNDSMLPDNLEENLFHFAEITAALRRAPNPEYAQTKSEFAMKFTKESPTRIFNQFLAIARPLWTILYGKEEMFYDCMKELCAGSIPHFRHDVLASIVALQENIFTRKDLSLDDYQANYVIDQLRSFVGMGLLKMEDKFQLTGAPGRPSIVFEKAGILKYMDSSWYKYFT